MYVVHSYIRNSGLTQQWNLIIKIDPAILVFPKVFLSRPDDILCTQIIQQLLKLQYSSTIFKFNISSNYIFVHNRKQIF